MRHNSNRGSHSHQHNKAALQSLSDFAIENVQDSGSVLGTIVPDTPSYQCLRYTKQRPIVPGVLWDINKAWSSTLKNWRKYLVFWCHGKLSLSLEFTLVIQLHDYVQGIRPANNDNARYIRIWASEAECIVQSQCRRAILNGLDARALTGLQEILHQTISVYSHFIQCKSGVLLTGSQFHMKRESRVTKNACWARE